MTDIERVSDELAIRNLVATYSDGISMRDPDIWGSVWADEGARWVLGSQVFEGADEIVSFWVRAVEAYAWLVQVANSGVVFLDGSDVATGRFIISEHGMTSDGTHRRLLAIYHDRYVRTTAGWRIQERVLEPVAIGAQVEGIDRPDPYFPGNE
ncbi:MAG TPA: nuclear transport factor 2 family protein [Acidimicrobiales bacterium]